MKWNATKLEQAADCLFKCYLINVEKERYPATGPMKKGRLLHTATQTDRFFNADGTPFYRTPESFTNAMVAKWKYVLRKAREGEEEISWKYDEEPWKLMKDIKEMSPSVYMRYVREGPPTFCEKPFDIEVDGRRINGRLDEIRRGPVFRDKKTGNSRPGEMTLAYNHQFTIYNLAICVMAMKDPVFADMVGLTPEDVEMILSGPSPVSERIRGEYYFMKNDELIEMPRDQLNYAELCETIDDYDERIESGNAHPERGYHCDGCEVKAACDSRSAAVFAPASRASQLDLFGEMPHTPSPKRKKTRPYQRRLGFK